MRFLSQGTGRKFLGAALSAGRFLGKNSQVIQRGLSSINQFAQNAQVQKAAAQIGVSPAVLKTVSRGLTNVENTLAAAPQITTNVRQVGQGVVSGLQPARQSIASLYAQANAR